MNTALEFHDCRVASIATEGEQILVNFASAYLHRSEGVPGIDEGTGWVQEARLTFGGATWEGSAAIGDGWLVDGQLVVCSSEPMLMVPVPFEATGAVSARFLFGNGSRLEIAATFAQLTLLGEAQYVEDYAGG